MKLELRNNKDFWAGMMFFGTGAGAMIVAWLCLAVLLFQRRDVG